LEEIKLSRCAVASCGTMDICDLLVGLSVLQHTRNRACNYWGTPVSGAAIRK